MDLRGVSSQHSTIFSLDEILQDISETPTEELPDIEETYHSYKAELSQELKTTDKVWVEFHAGQCEQFGKAAKSLLYRILNSSIACPESSIAAANAITILKTMKVSFSCLDLQGVQIPGADLSSAILDKADLSDANLENANLTNSSLNGTNMSGVNLKNVKFGMPDVIIYEDIVRSSIISPDKKYLISEDVLYIYFCHLPSKTYVKKIRKEKPRSSIDHLRFSKKIFTPDGQFLFIFDDKRDINIYLVKDSVKLFEKIGSLKIIDQKDAPEITLGRFEEENEEVYFAFSPNGEYFITCRIEQGAGFHRNHLKIWEVHTTESKLLNINLKNDIITLNYRSKLYFSETFPVFYCFENEISKTLYLRVYSVDKLPKVANINDLLGNQFIQQKANGIDIRPEISNDKELSNCFVDIFITFRSNTSKYGPSEALSLVLLDTKKSGEELLFIAVDNSIYSVRILKKNEQNWPLESTQVTKIITEIDVIFSIKILVKTQELLYICKDTICLYSIKNNQLIGKFRLFDTKLKELSVFPDEASIYINYQNKGFIYSVEALKNSKYISYDVDKEIVCFSPDMRSIISISNNYDMQICDIENGNMLRSKPLERLKSLVSKGSSYKISFSLNSQHIVLSHDSKAQVNDVGHFVHIINIENEKTIFETAQAPEKFLLSSNSEFPEKFVLSSNSEYLAITNKRNILEIYKTTPSKQCIGQFSAEHRDINKTRYFEALVGIGYNRPTEEYKIIPSKQSTGQFRVESYNVDSMVIAKNFRKTPRIILNLEFVTGVLPNLQLRTSILTIVLNFTFRDEELELVSQKKLNQEENHYLQCMFIENDSKLIVVYTSKMIIWEIDNNQCEEYNLQASCANVSHDESLFIYYSRDSQANTEIHQLCLWSITQKKLLIVQALSFAIDKLEISSDNRYIIGTVENGGIYVWEILEDTFRLLWRTSHNLQTQGLMLDDNSLERGVEEELIAKMGAMKITST